MNPEIKIKSFNGIGDLLFVTPTLRRIRETYGREYQITVNTNYPDLLIGNPNVDHIGRLREGIFLGYPDPIHARNPTEHHIISDWRIVCKAFSLRTPIPDLKPEIYLRVPERKRRGDILIQTIHKGQWGKKKVWPYFKTFAMRYGYKMIPVFRSITDLVYEIAEARAVVCSEGGISHIAKAVGTPAIVIFGGWANPMWNGYQDHCNITNFIDCSYCYNPRKCVNDRELACMLDIKTDTVQERLVHYLEEVDGKA